LGTHILKSFKRRVIPISKSRLGKKRIKNRYIRNYLKIYGRGIAWQRILPITVEEHNLQIYRVKDYSNIKSIMRATKSPAVTSYIRITAANDTNEEQSKIIKIINNVCNLLSFIKGTQISWLYYEKTKLQYLFASVHVANPTAKYSRSYILGEKNMLELKDFLEESYQNYIEKDSVYSIADIITKVVDAKQEEFGAHAGLSIGAAVDIIRGRWAKKHKRVYIIPNKIFRDDNNQEIIKEGLEGIFKKIYPDFTNEQRDDVITKMLELNRPSFKVVLLEMLENFNVKSFEEEKIELFIFLRNSLVHEGIFPSSRKFCEKFCTKEKVVLEGKYCKPKHPGWMLTQMIDFADKLLLSLLAPNFLENYVNKKY
jgi:CRISPR/Cas system-associated exonuclease Cas4 (RecB family)